MRKSEQERNGFEPTDGRANNSVPFDFFWQTKKVVKFMFPGQDYNDREIAKVAKRIQSMAFAVDEIDDDIVQTYLGHYKVVVKPAATSDAEMYDEVLRMIEGANPNEDSEEYDPRTISAIANYLRGIECAVSDVAFTIDSVPTYMLYDMIKYTLANR